MKILVVCCLAALAFAAHAEEVGENNTGVDEHAVKQCRPNICAIECNRAGMRGQCVGILCHCIPRHFAEDLQTLEHRLEPLEQIAEAEMAKRPKLKCLPKRCAKTCRTSGMRGVCTDFSCQCVPNRFAENLQTLAESLKPLEETTEAGVAELWERGCHPITCEVNCRKKGRQGRCISNKCKCVQASADDSQTHMGYLIANKQPAEIAIEELGAAKCKPKNCAAECRLARMRGRCVGFVCQCFRNLFAETFQTLEEHLEPLEQNAEAEFMAEKCLPEICTRSCEKKGRKRGRCVTGRCVCQ